MDKDVRGMMFYASVSGYGSAIIMIKYHYLDKSVGIYCTMYPTHLTSFENCIYMNAIRTVYWIQNEQHWCIELFAEQVLVDLKKLKGPLTIRRTPLPTFLVNFSTFAFLLNISFMK